MKKLKITLSLLIFSMVCVTAQAQLTRCTDPTTKRITLVQGQCPESMRAETINVPSNSGIKPDPLRREESSARANRAGPSVSTMRHCKRRCPNNASICLEWY